MNAVQMYLHVCVYEPNTWIPAVARTMVCTLQQPESPSTHSRALGLPPSRPSQAARIDRAGDAPKSQDPRDVNVSHPVSEWQVSVQDVADV